MRPAARVLVTAAVAGCTALGPALAAMAAGSGTITTGPKAEGWYRTSPACALPTGCPPLPSPYAADTLHIGVDLGTETDRTVLQLDLTSLPAGTKPAGGQLRVPVATGSQDGTRSPETAKLRACPVTEAVKDADGSYDPAPKADCDSASVDAVFVAAAGTTPAAFTVDLTALATEWQDATYPGALALLPAEGAAPTDSWHVAVSTRDRAGTGVAKVTAAVSYVGSSVDTDEVLAPPVTAPIDSGTSGAAALPDTSLSAPEPVVQEPAPQPQAPAVAAPAAPTAPAALAPVAFSDGSFRYPAVFLLPLVFGLAAAWLGRALTRDLTAS
jgi:hypothetical protein